MTDQERDSLLIELRDGIRELREVQANHGEHLIRIKSVQVDHGATLSELSDRVHLLASKCRAIPCSRIGERVPSGA